MQLSTAILFAMLHISVVVILIANQATTLREVGHIEIDLGAALTIYSFSLLGIAIVHLWRGLRQLANQGDSHGLDSHSVDR